MPRVKKASSRKQKKASSRRVVKKSSKKVSKKSSSRKVKKAVSFKTRSRGYTMINRLPSKYMSNPTPAIPKIVGQGDYTVYYNSLATSSQTPQFSSADGGVRIRHREFIADIAGSSAFALTASPINPGLSPASDGLFPWLSTVASNFEQYRFNGLVLEFRTTSGTSVGATNTSLGTIMMATLYNSTLPDFDNKQEMLNYEYSCSGVPSNNLLHAVECKRSENVLSNLYVRSSGVPSTADVRLYDLGRFQIAAQGMQGTNAVGQLWVSYDITLFKPKLGANPFQGHVTATTAITTSAYFGTNPTQKATNTGIISCGSASFTLPSDVPLGYYQITYQVTGDSTASVVAPTLTLTSGASNSSTYFFDNGGTWYCSTGAATSTRATFTAFVEVTASSPVFTLSGGVLPATATSMDLIVTQVNSRLS